MKLTWWLDKVIPILLARTTKRIDGSVDAGEVSIYWVGNLLRLDIKPRAEGSSDGS